MQTHEMQSIIDFVIAPIRDKLNQASGSAVRVELLMRLLAQFHDPLRKKIKELVAIEKQKNPKSKKSDNYWNCDLVFIDNAIDTIFHAQLHPNERITMQSFRKKRNKLLHADFIALMNELKIEPTGREILTSGKRNILNETNIREAIGSIDRNRGLEIFRDQAEMVILILHKLLLNPN